MSIELNQINFILSTWLVHFFQKKQITWAAVDPLVTA